MSEPLSVVILAAGKGTRMRNSRPKVLHSLAGLPMIGHVLRTVLALAPERLVVVLARGMDEVAAAVLRLAPGARIAWQNPPMGTGHAVMAVRDVILDRGTVLVVYGDTPLVTVDTCRALIAAQRDAAAAVAVLGIRPPEPSGYGRLQVEGGRLLAIVEEQHAGPLLKRDGMANAGAKAFDAARLAVLLDALPLRPEKQEYYLTDCVEQAIARGWTAVAVEGPWVEGLGVNSQAQLAAVAAHLQARLRDRLLEGGVIMPAPETVQLAFDSEVAAGAIIEPYVVFGPGVRIAEGAVVRAFSHIEGTSVGRDASVGPFARLRPGTVLEAGARVGNFVEAKAARLGSGAKINHLSYIGDADVGAGANIGAGTITCNYDGFAKHRTEIGAGAFIGSNTALVAPVVVGPEAIVGAGSTITRDVPARALAVARGRQENLEQGAVRLRARRRRGPG